MKQLIKTSFVFLFLIGCNGSVKDELSIENQEQIKGELTVIIDTIYGYSEGSNPEDYLQKSKEIYWNSDMFVGIDQTNTYNYQEWMEDIEKTVQLSKGYTINKEFIDFKIIDTDIVLVIMKASIIATLMDDTKVTVSPYLVSLLFRKIEGKWKVTFYQEDGEVTLAEQDSTNLN